MEITKLLLAPVNYGLAAVGHIGKFVLPRDPEVGEDFTVDVTKEEFKDAVTALQWASYAYDLTADQAGKGEFKDWTCQSGDFDTQSVVGLVDKTVVVSFRGTESSTDAEIDAELLKTDDPDFPGRVHKGFLKQFYAGETSVTTVVKDLYAKNEIDTIVVTGHSLGAALATLYAVRMLKFYPNLNVKVITFGSPRVGDEEFAAGANAKFTASGKQNIHNRWAHANDIVTRSPKIGYYHTGRFCYLSTMGTIKISNNSDAERSWTYAFEDRFDSWIDLGMGVAVKNHLRDGYKTGFDRAAAKLGW